jgi:hypothetical protein
LQNRKTAGSVARIPAPEIETLVCDGVRRHLGSMGESELLTTLAERELIERHVARVIVKPQASILQIFSRRHSDNGTWTEEHLVEELAGTSLFALPFSTPSRSAEISLLVVSHLCFGRKRVPSNASLFCKAPEELQLWRERSRDFHTWGARIA